MRPRFSEFAILFLLVACGCHSSTLRSNQAARKQPDTLPQWDWASAIPSSVPRAELVPLTINRTTLAGIVSNGSDTSLQLASGPSAPEQLRLTHVAGKPVRNFEQLHAVVERAADSKNRVPVAWTGAAMPPVPTGGPSDSTGSPARNGDLGPNVIEIAPAMLRHLEQGVANSQKVIRVAEDGNPWIIIRDDNVRCKLTARIERTSGLMQLVMSLGFVSGQAERLPVDVRASCQGEPLQCLTVAETLEALYGDESHRERTKAAKDSTNIDRTSFAAVSQLDDYQIPTNYKRLQDETKRATGLPALAVVPGAVYPGSPVLGDARALSSFMLAPQLCQPGEPEQLGWIIFSGQPLTEGGTVEVRVDLGHGAIPVAFTVPKP